MLPVICLSWFHRSTFSYIFFPPASLVPRLTACVPTPPERGNRRSHTPGSPFLLPPSHISAPSRSVASPTFRHGGAEMAAGIDVGACRRQTAGREGVGDRQKRFRWLSHVPFFFDLPCLLAFFSPLRRDLFFLYCASLWVTLYDNLRHVLDMGGKRRDLGIGREGFRRGTVGPGVGNALKTEHGHILRFFTTSTSFNRYHQLY